MVRRLGGPIDVMMCQLVDRCAWGRWLLWIGGSLGRRVSRCAARWVGCGCVAEWVYGWMGSWVDVKDDDGAEEEDMSRELTMGTEIWRRGIGEECSQEKGEQE